MKNAAKRILDNLPKLKASFEKLTREEVLVGVPADEATRKDEKGSMNNATLAYIHDNGSPAMNIPARPFMKPGIEAGKTRIVAQFKIGAKKALSAGDLEVEKALNKAGLIAQGAIRNEINEGIGPPLKASTLKARIRAKTGVKGAKAELAYRKAGGTPGMGNSKPLIATAQMRNAINYVLRRKGNGAA